jgi:hypothetical protein
MAQILIIVNDDPQGNVLVNLHMEPQVQPGQGEFTPAQRMGAVALNAINAALTEEKPLIELPHNGKLEIIGGKH